VSETTLNLIAVTIFTLVMTSLLGPLLHISPVVPAIAAFGILGIATLDTLSLQGKAGTLLVDWFNRFSPGHRDRVIRHEAGHFLVAQLLEISVTGYTLSAWEAFRQGQPGLGGVSFELPDDASLNRGILSPQLIDRYFTVWVAGAAAETLVYGDAQGGADDRQKLQILWAQLKRSDAEGALKERWAILQAKTLLQEHWAAYEALVAAMEQRASVETCRQLISQHLATAN
jgi:hypothetical protein